MWFSKSLHGVESFLLFPPLALHVPVSLKSVLSIVILGDLSPILLHSFLSSLEDARTIADKKQPRFLPNFFGIVIL